MNRLGKWILELTTTLPLEKITYMVKDKQSTSDNIWGPFKGFLENKDLSHIMEAPVDDQ